MATTYLAASGIECFTIVTNGSQVLQETDSSNYPSQTSIQFGSQQAVSAPFTDPASGNVVALTAFWIRVYGSYKALITGSQNATTRPLVLSDANGNLITIGCWNNGAAFALSMTPSGASSATLLGGPYSWSNNYSGTTDLTIDLQVSGVGTKTASIGVYLSEVLVGTVAVDLSAYSGFQKVTCGPATADGGDISYLHSVLVADYSTIGSSIYRVFPGAAGTHQDWTLASLAALSAVPPNSAGITTTSSGEKSTFTGAAISLDSTHEIAAVRVTAYGAMTQGSPAHIAGMMRSSGTDQIASQQALAVSNGGFSFTFDTDPATGKAWTLAAFNAAEFGVESAT